MYVNMTREKDHGGGRGPVAIAYNVFFNACFQAFALQWQWKLPFFFALHLCEFFVSRTDRMDQQREESRSLSSRMDLPKEPSRALPPVPSALLVYFVVDCKISVTPTRQRVY